MSGESTKARQSNTLYVFAGLGGPRSARLPLAVVVLAVSLLATGAPMGVASQFDDLGTNDPHDVEGVDEPPWRAWHTSTIQGAGLFHKETAVGPDGEPYITWHAGGGVWIAWRDSGSAEFETNKIDKGRARSGGIAIAEDGQLWVAYTANHRGDLSRETYVATASDPSGEWTRWRIEPREGWHPRVAIDGSGTAHVVYEDNQTTLIHATYAPAEGWTHEEITQVLPSGTRDIDFAIAGDRLHVVWAERFFENERIPPNGYAVRTIGEPGWTVESIPTEPFQCGHEPEVGASPDGSAWVVCRGFGGVQAFHRSVAGDWRYETVTEGEEYVPSRTLGGGTSVAVGSDGVPHVAFRTEEPTFCGNTVLGPGQPQYAARVDGDWGVETVNHVERASGYGPSLSLGADDRPHIAFSLRYRLDPTPCHPCPGCGLVNQLFKLQYAEPVIATAGDVTGLDT